MTARLSWGLLEGMTAQRSWIGFGYCLMDNHIHLVATTPKADVGDGMRDLLARYARYFNRRHGRTDISSRSATAWW